MDVDETRDELFIDEIRNDLFHEKEESGVQKEMSIYDQKKRTQFSNGNRRKSRKKFYLYESGNAFERNNSSLSMAHPNIVKEKIKRRKNIRSFKNVYNNIISFIKENKNDMKKIRHTLFLRAYENSELYHMKRENKKEKLNMYLRDNFVDEVDAVDAADSVDAVDTVDAKERLKLLKMLKRYDKKYEGYTELYTLCDYSIYFQDKNVVDVLLQKEKCEDFFYYLVNIGISYNDIIQMASVFENMKYLKGCIILIMSYIMSIIKCIDAICLQISYISYYFMDKNPWVYKNIDTKICSKFNGSRNICDFSRNICYYDETTRTCEINKMKLGIRMYDTLLDKYVEPKSEKFTSSIVMLSFLLLLLYNGFSKYKTSHKITELFIFLLVLLFITHIITLRDFSLIEYLFTDFSLSRIWNLLCNHEVWVLCMLHCTINMSLHSGMYFYSSKGLRYSCRTSFGNLNSKDLLVGKMERACLTEESFAIEDD
ncbi:amino acid transporter, putative [Plasmodium ovale wallikeri]|uniref:Amino acid transporter, putative n=1 Tax=Plasmodium ovale wallikeri TaxID=864142 RepID=A0A1A8YXK2_PLAOA|nr:amino acid transporter, putative [Plasmodium ovale wallikeri]SBT36733.1 amino acid transporter, putative [Plasmodium ovale wallikeri]